VGCDQREKDRQWTEKKGDSRALSNGRKKEVKDPWGRNCCVLQVRGPRREKHKGPTCEKNVGSREKNKQNEEDAERWRDTLKSCGAQGRLSSKLLRKMKGLYSKIIVLSNEGDLRNARACKLDGTL